MKTKLYNSKYLMQSIKFLWVDVYLNTIRLYVQYILFVHLVQSPRLRYAM